MSTTFLPTLAEALASRYTGKTWEEQKTEFTNELNIGLTPPDITLSNNPTLNKYNAALIVDKFCEWYKYSEIGQYPIDKWVWNVRNAFDKTWEGYWSRLRLLRGYMPLNISTIGIDSLLENKNYTDNIVKSGERTLTHGGSDSQTTTPTNWQQKAARSGTITYKNSESGLDNDTPKNMKMADLKDMDYASRGEYRERSETETPNDTTTTTYTGSLKNDTTFGKTETEKFNAYADKHTITGYDTDDIGKAVKSVMNLCENIVTEWLTSETIKQCFMGVLEYGYC